MTPHLAFELTHRVDQGRPVVQLLRPIELQGHVVPAGFRTDFASIPWLLWALIPVFGRSCKAAVLHDWGCYCGWPKAFRSRLFLDQMTRDHVPFLQRWAQYLAVLLWPGPETISGERISPP